MKHTTWKRLLSLLLVVAMVSSFGVNALAATGEAPDPWDNVTPTVTLSLGGTVTPVANNGMATVTATVTPGTAPEGWAAKTEYAYDWSVEGGTVSGDTSKTPTINVKGITADTKVSVTVTVTYQKDGTSGATNQETKTATAEITIPSWNDIDAPTMTLGKNPNTTVDIGNTVTVAANVESEDVPGWSKAVEYTWSTKSGTGNKTEQSATGASLTVNPEEMTYVYASATLVYSRAGQEDVEYEIGEVSATVEEATFANLNPTVTLTSNKTIETKDNAMTIAANKGDTVTITANVTPNTPTGWKADVKYFWDDDYVGTTEASKSVTVSTETAVTLTKVEITYSKEGLTRTETLQITDSKTITIKPGYSVSKENDGPNYKLVLKVDGEELTANPAMVPSGKTVTAEIVPNPGYVLSDKGVITPSNSVKISKDVVFGVTHGDQAVKAKTATLQFDLTAGWADLQNVTVDEKTLVTVGNTANVNLTYGANDGVAYPTATVEVQTTSGKKVYEITGWTVEKDGLNAEIAKKEVKDGDLIKTVAIWAEKDAVKHVITMPTSADTNKYTVTVSPAASQNKYSEDSEIKITVEAKAGYKLDTFTLTATNGKGVVTKANNAKPNEKQEFTYKVGDADTVLSLSGTANPIVLTFNFAENLKNGTALTQNGTTEWKNSAGSAMTLTSQTWTYTNSSSTAAAFTLPASGTLTGKSTVAADKDKSFELNGWTASATTPSISQNYGKTISVNDLRNLVSTKNLRSDTTITLTAKWDSTISLVADLDFNFMAVMLGDAYDSNYSTLSAQLRSAAGATSSTAKNYYIKFTDLGSSTAGTLYTGESRTSSTTVRTGTNYYLGYNGSNAVFDEIEFEPNKNYEEQSYVAKFSLYSTSSSTAIAEGTLTINTGIAADIVWYLDGEDSVQFDEEDFDDFYSTRSIQLDSVDFTLEEWSFSKSNGYVYYGGTDSDDQLTEKEFEKETYYYDSSSSSDMKLSELYYVVGSNPDNYYKFEFNCYDEDGRNKESGTLVIVTERDDEEDVSVDLIYNVKYTDTLALSGEDFYDYIDSKFEYVEFNLTNSVRGKLTVGTGSNADELGDDLDDDTPFYYSTNNSRYYEIDDITYTPYTTSTSRYSQYTDSISFTAYDSSDNEVDSGTLVICVVAEEVPQVTIEVDPNKSVNFMPNAFKEVASKAVGSSSGIDAVVLTSMPGTGTIYQGTGTTKATTGTNYSLATSGSKLLSSLRYVATSKEGSYTADYVAYDGTKVLYEGKILFVVGDTGLNSGDIYAVGSMLPVSAINNSADDLLEEDFSYITVKQPTNAIVYYNYGKINDHDGAVSESEKYYYKPTGSQLSMSKLTVVPYADRTNNEKIEVEITCYDEDDNAVKLTVTFTYTQASSAGFSDATESWYKDSIYFLSSNGIVNGVSNTQYGVGTNIKRGDFMLMLYRAFDLGSLTKSTSNFTDVKSADYYASAIAAAKALGITNGYLVDGQYYFYPERTITREEAFSLIYRTLNLSGVKSKLASSLPTATTSTLNVFSDKNSIQSYAQTAVAVLVKAELVKGSGGKINPANPISREEMAVILHRALTRF